jgi:hypothetical protein
MLSLGVIGQFAGKSGKQYSAQRVYMETTKSFRIPMARRMDASQIQLGYRLVISAGGAEARVNEVLCDYSVRSTPSDGDQTLPLFPSGTRTLSLRSDEATVYDVIQNEVFSSSDEDSFEKYGEVMGPELGRFGSTVTAGYSSPGKQRLYLERRRGKVALQLDIEFELDLTHPDQSFVGHANVSITNLEPEMNPDGVILHVQVYETGVSSVDDEVVERLADSMTVHIVPSFLLVDSEYFGDRSQGWQVLEGIVNTLDREYSLSRVPGPIDPMWKFRRLAVR